MPDKIFISVPYTDDNMITTEWRVAAARSHAVALLNEGMIPVCPVLQGHDMILNGPLIEIDNDAWLEFALAFLTDDIKEVHVLQLDGWEKSKGCEQEIKIAQLRNIPIVWVHE